MRTLEIKFENIKQPNQLLAFLNKSNIEYVIKDSDGFFTQIFTEKEPTHAHKNEVNTLSNESDNDPWDAAINGKMIGALASKSSSFDFLNADEEDIYSETDLKVKY